MIGELAFQLRVAGCDIEVLGTTLNPPEIVDRFHLVNNIFEFWIFLNWILFIYFWQMKALLQFIIDSPLI